MSNESIYDLAEANFEKMVEYGRYLEKNGLDNTEENYNCWLEKTDMYMTRQTKKLIIDSFFALADINNKKVRVSYEDNVVELDEYGYYVSYEFCNGLSIHIRDVLGNKYDIFVKDLLEMNDGNCLCIGEYTLEMIG